MPCCDDGCDDASLRNCQRRIHRKQTLKHMSARQMIDGGRDDGDGDGSLCPPAVSVRESGS
jgi:hypothetical protein